MAKTWHAEDGSTWTSDLNGANMRQVSGPGGAPVGGAKNDPLQGVVDMAGTTHANARSRLKNAVYPSLDEFEQASTGANAQDRADLGTLQGVYDPLMQQVGASGYVGDAQSSAGDMARQQQVYDQMQAASNPQVTGQERYLMELARGKQEQQERSSRDQVMGDLAARGMSGSGAQLTNMMGASQQNSQNRLLADLGTQAGAVNRAQNAMGMAGQVAGQMRTSGDAMAMANKQMQNLHANFADTYGASERNRVAGLGDQMFNASTGVTNTGVGRVGEVGNARIKGAQAINEGDQTGFENVRTATNTKVGKDVDEEGLKYL